MHIQSAAVDIQSQRQFQRQQSTRPISPPRLDSEVEKAIQKTSMSSSSDAVLGGYDAETLIIKRVLEAFLGREIFLNVAYTDSQLDQNSSAPLTIEQGIQQGIQQASMQSDSLPQQWVKLSLSEQEVTQYSVSAEITLASGQVRTILIEETMARSLSMELEVTTIEAAHIMDPLVINFGGPVKLSDQRVEFDLNADGHKDSIASFASNSAYLAWDRNTDGKINNGSELFGALTGDGFTELKAFDEDGNGFIDQHDAIYSQLQLFDPNKNTSRSLNASGVEAICLTSASTPFTLADKSGDALGFVRNTSFYVTEYGAGTIQQIDLVV